RLALSSAFPYPTLFRSISCLGNSLAEIEASLRTGRSGIAVDPARVGLGFRSPLTGVVNGFDPGARLDRKARKTMHESVQWQAHADRKSTRLNSSHVKIS